MKLLRPTGGWGYNEDTEILFPIRVAPKLEELRGIQWSGLVKEVLQTSEASLEQLAFTLLFVRLSGCLTCHADSYRAMRGCTDCATHSVRRFRGEDSELISIYDGAREEVKQYLQQLSEDDVTEES